MDALKRREINSMHSLISLTLKCTSNKFKLLNLNTRLMWTNESNISKTATIISDLLRPLSLKQIVDLNGMTMLSHGIT